MQAPKYIPSLTPLRGIAAILVLIFHFHLLVMPLQNTDHYHFIGKWYLMVDLFFVLSGFILYHVYGQYFHKGWDVNHFKKYIWARLARIYPLHLVTLLYAIGLYIFLAAHHVTWLPVEEKIFDVKAIPTSLLLIDAWGMHSEATWNTPSWSISVEWFAYLMFPFLITPFLNNKKLTIWILGVISVTGLLAIMFWLSPWNFSLRAPYLGDFAEFRTDPYIVDVITGPALLRGLCGFIIGMISYHLYRQGWGEKRLGQSTLNLILWVLLLLGWNWQILPDVIAIFAFGILILSTAYVRGWLKVLLNTKLMTYLGDISYSIYMVHMLILFTFLGYQKIHPPNEVEALPNFAVRWAMVAVFLLLTIGIASLTFYTVEQPARKYLRKLFRGRVVLDKGL